MGVTRELGGVSRALLFVSLGSVGPVGMDDKSKKAPRVVRFGPEADILGVIGQN